jgi:heme/copper-type cytochrome/quinol oxidase subunit 2
MVGSMEVVPEKEFQAWFSSQTETSLKAHQKK